MFLQLYPKCTASFSRSILVVREVVLKSPIYGEITVLTSDHPGLRKIRILDLDDVYKINGDLNSVFDLEDLEEFEYSVNFENYRDHGNFICYSGEMKSRKLTSIKIRHCLTVNPGFSAADMCLFLDKQTNLRSLHLEDTALQKMRLWSPSVLETQV